jgi:hypothetical protein
VARLPGASKANDGGSGFIISYKSVLGAGAKSKKCDKQLTFSGITNLSREQEQKAKTVTSNLPLALSVLAAGLFINLFYIL